MIRKAFVERIPTSGPDDISGLDSLFEMGKISPQNVVAVLAKVEGNGCVNDFSRGFATQSLALALSKRLGISMEKVSQKVALVMSGGTEGALCPHINVFGREECEGETKVGEKRLAVGVSFTRNFLPEELGRMAQVEETANAVLQAMGEAGISDISDVHLVQIKCPLLTKERIESAKQRAKPTVTESTLSSMAFSRAASALGVALALKEIQSVKESDICKNWSLYSSVASTSAGIELLNNEIMVLGNSVNWGGSLQISHSVMKDAIDMEACRRALHDIGIDAVGQVTDEQRKNIVAVLAKAEASQNGLIRGRRHTMLDDSDISATRHARALVGGVLSALIGDPCIYVSGGGEHQGPDGGSPVAVIAHVV